MYEVFINGKKKEACKIVTLVIISTVENSPTWRTRGICQ